MILPSLDSSRYGESDRKKIIKIQSLDAEKINFEVFYYLYLKLRTSRLEPSQSLAQLGLKKIMPAQA
jgi:hypothetical protein